ncbi:MAG: outer membrane protein transport protein, partial [Desulfobulbaceae bacterium]|nr:outer membrane protein transport protein [Desulfobulbaceae bacterium]
FSELSNSGPKKAVITAGEGHDYMQDGNFWLGKEWLLGMIFSGHGKLSRREKVRCESPLIAFLLAALLFSPTSSWADGIVNRQTQSSDYTRTLTRHAATDGLDAIVYNPAGVMRMKNGLQAQLDSTVIYKEYVNTVPGYGELKDSNRFGIIPGFFSLYKQDRWAGFFSVTIPGGGGIVDYDKGDAATVTVANSIISATPYNRVDRMSLEASSVYYGLTAGAAYAFSDSWSVAAGLRQVEADIEVDANIGLSVSGFAARDFKVKYDQEANGMSGFFGVDYTPSDHLTVGLLYQSNTRLLFDTTVDRDDVHAVGTFAKSREDLPGLLAAGIGFRLRPDLRLDVNYTLFLEKNATWEGRLAGQGNSSDIAASAEYTCTPQWKVNLSGKDTRRNITPDAMGAESPELDSVTVSVGAVWTPTSLWRFNFGLGEAFFEDAVTSRGVRYEKEAWALSTAVQRNF